MKGLLIIVILISESNCNTLSRYLFRTEHGSKSPEETYSGRFDDKKYIDQDLLGEQDASAGERGTLQSSSHLFLPFKRILSSLNLPQRNFLPHKRSHDLSKRSTRASTLPIDRLASFGNIKQFFSDLKKSLDGETFEPPTDSSSLSFLKKKGKTGYGPHGETSTFVFPHHIRRMMFGSQHSQPYSHSSLGR